MAESTTTRFIRAPRTKPYDLVADVEARAKYLQPEGTSWSILGHDLPEKCGDIVSV